MSVLDAELPNLVQFVLSPLAGVLAKRLLDFVPYLDKVFFANSGTESVEAAIKFARRDTRQPRILFCDHAFHGLTDGALSLNGSDAMSAYGFEPRCCRTAGWCRSTISPRSSGLASRDIAEQLRERVRPAGEGCIAHMQEILKTEFGGMSEVLYNLAAATGEEKWARAGDRFAKMTFFTPLALRRDELKGLHANTHIPQAVGAARRYEISSDPRFRQIAGFFWHTVAEARSYATGGTSNREFWRADPGRLAQEWRDGIQHQECCCAYNMMKLTRRLYEWSGDPRYFDYYERVLFNHRLGAIQPETGHSMYFLSLAPGAWKTWNTEDRSFWCCTGTALEEFAKLNDSIYYQDSGGIYVNLFIASELDAREMGIGLRQETRFPEEPRTGISITTTPPSAFALRLRIPAWADGASAKLNGRKLDGMAGAGGYLDISRAWKKGDRVDLELPMRLAPEAFPDDPTWQAFLYGPIVLAGDLGWQGLADSLVQDRQGPETDRAPMETPTLKSSGKDPAEWLKPAGSSPLDFQTTGQPREIAFRPLNRLWQRFAVYWKVS